MPSFRGWVHEEVQRQFKRMLPKPAHEVIDETFTVIRHRAEQRGRQALLHGMGAADRFKHDAMFHHAIDQLVLAVVAGIFGEVTFTSDSGLGILQEFIDETIKDASAGLSWASAVHATPAEVTMESVMAAVEKMKQHPVHYMDAPPPPKKVPTPYGPVVMGRSRGKRKPTGLPAAQDVQAKQMMKQVAEDAALATLAAKVEKKADELLGIKQKAKYEELVGIDPEEI